MLPGPRPTLIAHGREGRVIPLENSLGLLQMIDNARLHVFGKCGRWTKIGHTGEFADLLYEAERDRSPIPPPGIQKQPG